MGFNPFRWIAAAWQAYAKRRRLRRDRHFYYRLGKKFGVKLMLTGHLSDINSASQHVAAAIVLASEAAKRGYKLEECQAVLDTTKSTLLLVPANEQGLVNYFVAGDNRFELVDLGSGLDFAVIDVTVGQVTEVATRPVQAATKPESFSALKPHVGIRELPQAEGAAGSIREIPKATPTGDSGPSMARVVLSTASTTTTKTTEVRTGARRALEAYGEANGLDEKSLAFDAAKFVESLDLDYKFENYLETEVSAEFTQETGRFVGSRRSGVPVKVRGATTYAKLVSAAEQCDWDQRGMLVVTCKFIDKEGRLELFQEWLASNPVIDRSTARDPGAFVVVQANAGSNTAAEATSAGDLQDDGTF